MDFFNKLGKKASETYQVTKEKATNISGELKIKGKISDIKGKIEKQYSQIGKIVYEELKNGNDVSKDEVTQMCEEISRMNEEISKLEVELLTIKKVKKCANCGTELDIEAEFCSKCGKEQPKIEKIEVRETVTDDAKEAEVVDVNDSENN